MADNYNSRWTGEQIDDAVALARQGSIITGAAATTLAAGSAATATVENNVLKIGVPKGPAGPAYTLTETDKNTIAAAVKDSLTTETWTFTLEDGSIVRKKIYLGEIQEINFTINGDTYIADRGMTWVEWFASNYNTTGKTADDVQSISANGVAVELSAVIVGGTAYEVGFGPAMVMVTITVDGDGTYAFLDIGGSEYYEEQTVELPVGTVILCCLYGNGEVYLNDNLYASGSGEWEYTATKNCAIHLTDYSSAGRIDITEQ